MEGIITLDYGSGGQKTSELIENLIVSKLYEDSTVALLDSACISTGGKSFFTTDSFVVSPVFFPGGDIGKLSVCGSVNDIAVSGGKAEYMSLSLIIEEGFEIDKLEKIISSIAEEARKNGVKVVTGDTKVVEKNRGDGIYINTACVGKAICTDLTPKNIRAGDKVIVSGEIGDHGTAVMLARSGMLEGNLLSDCAGVFDITEKLMSFGRELRLMRDPTRGGIATTLNEFIEDTKFSIELKEDSIPVNKAVNAACEILGLDPLYCACEGRVVAVVSETVAEEALKKLKELSSGRNAAIIGEVTEKYPGRLVMHTKIGGGRVLQKLSGAQLPRIC